MTTLIYVLYLIVSFAGSFMQTISGFGFSVVTMAIFPYFMHSYQLSLTVSSLMAFSTDIVNVVPRRKAVKMKLILPPLLGYFIFAAVAVFFSVGTADSTLSTILGAALILLSLYFIFIKNNLRIKPTFVNGVIAGALSGVMGGMFSISGPPIVVYTLAITKDQEEYFATNMAYFAITNLYTAVIRAINGLITPQVILLWAIGTIMVFVGVFCGRKLVKKINPIALRKVIYIFMAVSGALMIIENFI